MKFKHSINGNIFLTRTQLKECGIFIVKSGGTYGSHWAFRG
jgi:hypothetical protein